MNLSQLVTHLQTQANALKQTPSNAQSVSNFYKSIENLLYQTYDQELSNKHITSNEHFVLDKKTFNGIPVLVQSSGIGLGKKTVIATISYGKYLSGKLQNTVAYLQSLMQKNPSHSARYQQQITSLQPELSQINPQLYYRRVAVRKDNIMIPTHLHTLSKQDVLQFINQAINVISFINKRGADQSQLNQLQGKTTPTNRQSLFQPTTTNQTQPMQTQTQQSQVKPKKKSHHFSLFHKSKKSKSKSHKNHGGFFNKVKQFGSYMNSRPSESSSTPRFNNTMQNNNASAMSYSTNTTNMSNYNSSSQFAQPTVNNNLRSSNQMSSQSKTPMPTMATPPSSSDLNLNLNLTAQSNSSSNINSNVSNKYKPLTNTLNNTKYNPNLNSFETSSQSLQSNSNTFDTVRPKSVAFSPAQSSNVDDESLYNEYQSSQSAKSSISASMSTSASLSASISSASVSTSQSLSNSYHFALSVKTSIAISQEHAKMSSAYNAKNYATSMNSTLRSDMSNMNKRSSSSISDNTLDDELNNTTSSSVTNTSFNDSSSSHTSASKSFSYQKIADALKKSKLAKSSSSATINSQSVSVNNSSSASSAMSSANPKLHSMLSKSSAQSRSEMHGSAVAFMAQIDLENKSISSACSSEVASVGAQNNSLINKMQLQAKGFASAKSSLISSASSAKNNIKGSAELTSYQQSKASSNTVVVLKASASSKYTSLASSAQSANKSMATSIISRAQNSISSANFSATSTVTSVKTSASTAIHSLSDSDATKLTSVQASATSVSTSASSVAQSAKSNHDTLTYIIDSQKHQIVFYKQMVHYMNKYYQSKIDDMLQPALDGKNMHDGSVNLIKKINKTHNFNWLTAKKFSNYKDFLQFMNRYHK